MSTRLVYVAGPYRADTPWLVERNVRAAEGAALLIAQLGAVPVVPHSMYRHFDKSLPDEFFLEGTLEIMRRCDGVAFLPGWDRSTGARGEHAEALALRLPMWKFGGPCDQLSTLTEWTPAFGVWLRGGARRSR